jgi:phage/plasmid-associated DNA primase
MRGSSNCENRTVDLRTGELLRHRLADLSTKMASVD